jgi:hypothetical protein
VTATTLTAARDAIVALHQALRTAPLNQTDAASARAWVGEIAGELNKDRPNPPVVENRLHRLTSMLKSTGALAATGATLLNPLRTVAGWLGELGEATMRLLA